MLFPRDPRRREVDGFTLIEIISVIVVLGLLASFSVPIYTGIRKKAEGMVCAGNLRTLYGGASAYLQDHQAWPRILPPKNSGGAPPDSSYTSQWLEVYAPYGITSQNWRCPSIERAIRAEGKPGAIDRPRIDFSPTIFEGGPMAPYQWPTHPWFIEKGAAHGSGPLIILTNGAVVTVDELVRMGGK